MSAVMYTLSLHDALPISEGKLQDLLAAARSHTPVEALIAGRKAPMKGALNFVDNAVDPLIGTVRAKAVFDNADQGLRWEEHTSELQSRLQLVCRHLLEKI